MQILILRFDAPLMSFGGVMVDHHGVIERFPGLSLLTGLFGNALGYRHGDAEALEKLQAHIDYAARWDIEPEELVDYHTVDLGQPKMAEPGWTTRGEPEHRAGGAAAYGTHQRYRHYWANGVMTLSATLIGADAPTVADLAKALRRPARPLFLGRKTCLPASPILLGETEAPDLLAALRAVPRARRAGSKTGEAMPACWPAHLGESSPAREAAIYDRRDWSNQIHAGWRLRIEGYLEENAP
jgi:CRISPR system Cascade subunit CasD